MTRERADLLLSRIDDVYARCTRRAFARWCRLWLGCPVTGIRIEMYIQARNHVNRRCVSDQQCRF